MFEPLFCGSEIITQNSRQTSLPNRRVLQGAAPEGATTLLHLSSAPDPLFKASKPPFLTLRLATPSGAPRQALLDLFCGSERIPQNSRQTSHQMSLPKNQKKVHRRASAGLSRKNNLQTLGKLVSSGHSRYANKVDDWPPKRGFQRCKPYTLARKYYIHKLLFSELIS